MHPLIVISIDGLRARDVTDPRIRIPHIRALIERGGSADRLKTIFPSVTWAVHTSVVTGCLPAKTGIYGNSVYDRVAGRRLPGFDPDGLLFDRDQRENNLFDAFRRQGADIAAVCWPLTQGAGSIRFNIPEFYSQENFERFANPELWQELTDLGFPVHRYGDWSAAHALNGMQDALTRDIAVHLIKTQAPQATFLHFLLVDSLQHDYGVDSPEAIWAIEYVDSLVGDTIAGLDGTNVILFSDHGHAPTTGAFHVDHWLERNGFGGAPGTGPFVATGNGGAGFIYALGASESDTRRLAAQLQDLPWTKALWLRDQFDQIGFPIADRSPQGFLPDLVFELEEDHFIMTGDGAGIVVGPSQLRSMHGYSPDLASMDGFLACAGPDFNRGTRLKTASILDIAPTIDRIYGLGIDGMDGTGLAQFLRN